MDVSDVPFATLLGVKVTLATPDRLEAEMAITEALANRNGVLHGGALMAFADTMGGTATCMNIPADMQTTTIESKTNFLAALPIGDVAKAVATPLHRGRSTQVWQTTITRSDGRTAAIVTQTQMVLPRRRG